MLRSFFVCVLLSSLLILAGCGSNQTPSTPTGVTATATAVLTLSWNASPGASSYVIYRSTTSGTITGKTLLASGVSTTSFIDTSAVLNTPYYYQVTAFSSNGQSTPSVEVSATITPISLTVAKDSTTATLQNNLSWDAVPSAASYSIYRSTVSTPYYGSKLILSTTSPITTNSYNDNDTSLVAGTTYYYQVVALDANSAVLKVSSEASVLD